VPKTIAILGSALFFAVAPSTVAGLVPWWITRWEFRPPFFDLDATRAVGILLIVAGLPGLVDSFARFALQGLGTPAPIAPTQNLVVTGLYRYVRNPIYVALVAVILGQAALFGDQRLLAYGGSPSTRLSWGTRSRCSFVASERSTRISGPTSRAGFRGSRPGEPHDAGIIRDAGAAAGRAW
jgi:hypothetical protein